VEAATVGSVSIQSPIRFIHGGLVTRGSASLAVQTT